MVWRFSAGHSASRQNFIARTVLLLTVLAASCTFVSGASAAAGPVAATPKGVSALKVRTASGSLSYSWKAPVNARKVGVIGYRLEYRKASAKTWKKLKALSAKKTTYRLTGLRNGVAYQLRITPIGRAGLGVPRTITAIPRERGVGGLGTGPTATAPGVPLNFALASGMGRITAEWTAPALSGGSPVTRYDVRYRISPDGAWSELSSPSNEPGLTIPGLTPQLLYEVSVRAVNAVGPGAWSAALTAEPLPLMAVPSEPVNVVATGGLNNISVEWDPPLEAGDAPVSYYEVRLRKVGGAWSAPTLVDLPATSFSVVPTEDGEYEWSVRAGNTGGHGPWSASAFATVVVQPIAPVSVQAVRGDGSVALSWERAPSGGAPDSYTVRKRVSGTEPWTIAGTSATTSLVASGLTNGTSYEFWVQASNLAGHSQFASLVSAVPAGLPGQPQGLALTPADGGLSVSWTAPANTGGIPITYLVRHKLASSPTWGEPQAASGTTAVIGGLSNGGVYDVSVRAVNAVGPGGWSSTVSGTPATVPGAPEALELSAGDEVINAVWQPPGDNGGAAVSGYEVRHREQGGEWTPVVAVGDAGYSFTGLTDGTTYEVAVRAINARGSGAWVTGSATPVEPGALAPGVPTSLSVRVAGVNDALAVKWTAPVNGGAPDHYEVKTCSQAAPTICSDPQTVSGLAINAVISNAQVKIETRALVRAVNDSGASQWVQSASIFNPDLTLPVLRVDTVNSAPIVSKETYLSATYSLDPNGSSAVGSFAGATEIRGRGNSTWNAPKKPYRLKLGTSSALLSGVTKSRHWALLANYYDPSALRNAIAMRLGSQTGLGWTPKSQFVEVVLNGKYVGLYQLIETVRVDSARVNISKPPDADPASPDTGYLFELDGRLDGPPTNTFTTSKGADVVIKEPEDASAAQKLRLRADVSDFEDALYSANFDDPVNGYQKYVDMGSLVDWYLVNEFVANNDAMYSSTNLYKDVGQKIKWGPLWDYDQSVGRGWGTHPPDAWWVRIGGIPGTMAPWFSRLFQDPAFEVAVSSRWTQLAPQFAAAATYAGSIAPSLSEAAAQSESIWPKLSVAEQGAETSFAAATPVVQNWLTARYAWMNSHYGDG